MGKHNQKTIYISDDVMPVWEEIEEAAKKETRGMGFFLCEVWERHSSLINKFLKKKKES